MAWLAATPRPPDGTKRAARVKPGELRSRIDRLKADGVKPAMPPNPMPHLITRLVEIGLTEAAGMGVVPLSWREINEWQQATGVALAPWEARLLRRLSADYVAESRRAESETCPPPWRAPVSEREIAAAEARLRMVLG